jgi:hypothetical protein
MFRSTDRPHPLARFSMVAVLAVVTLIAIAGCSSENENEQTILALEREIGVLRPPHGSALVSSQRFSKDGFVFVTQTYSGSVSWPELQRHYDAELESRGWRPYRTDHVREWGRDLGGKAREYCKGKFSAELQYVGTRRSPWTFSITLVWRSGQSMCN